MASAQYVPQDVGSLSSRDPPMGYFIYLDIAMKCRHDFNRPTDSGDPVTSGHQAIPRWA